jgi:pimeloyl-ACP methyl ester carboxylesterase
MKIRIKDQNLYFDVDGAQLVPEGERMQERPTIVFLHGGPGFDHSHFKPAFTALRDQAQLVFLDQRGQGRSDRCDPSLWNLATWADDVAAFCEALSIRKPILLGASFGGFVAIGAATRHPELARGLILLGTAANVSIERVIARFGELGGPEAAKAARGLFTNPDDQSVVEHYFKTCFPLYARKGFDPLFVARSIATPEVMVHFFRPGNDYGTFNYLPDLRRASVPTLILHGELDPIVPVDLARATYDAFPKGVATFTTFADSSHDLVRDNWNGVLSNISEFIRTRCGTQ